MDTDQTQMFLKTNAPALFQHWRADVLAAFVKFQRSNHTLFTTDGGVAVAWRCWKGEVLLAVRGGRDVFTWRGDDPTGNTLWLGEFVCTAPGALRRLARQVVTRFPNWARLQVMTLRGKELVEYPGTRLARLLT